MAFDKQNLMKKLYKLEGYVARDYDPYQHIIEPASPSLAWTFDNTWGLPFGYSLLLWGEGKSGKSLIARMMAGDLHRQDPNAVVLYYNTEMREELQATPKMLQTFGIDLDRYAAYDVNRAEDIFDKIEQDVPKLIQEGLKIRLIVIDSLTQIVGRKMANSESVGDFIIGDNAATVGDGLLRIKSVLRKYHIACVLVAQARAELDQKEQMRGKKIKMAAAFATKHQAEYFMLVEHDKTVEGQKTLSGESLADTTIKNEMTTAKYSAGGDMAGRKMKVVMEQSSCGRDGRAADPAALHDRVQAHFDKGNRAAVSTGDDHEVRLLSLQRIVLIPDVFITGKS